MTVQFGQQAPRPPSQMPAVAEMHASTIASAIDRGWIMRGIKLGIGFWLAGVIIAALSAAFWFLVIGTAVAIYARATQADRAAPDDAGGMEVTSFADAPVNRVDPIAQVVAADAEYRAGQLTVIVENTSTQDFPRIAVECSILTSDYRTVSVASAPGSLDAGARVRVPLSPAVEPYELSGHNCRAVRR